MAPGHFSGLRVKYEVAGLLRFDRSGSLPWCRRAARAGWSRCRRAPPCSQGSTALQYDQDCFWMRAGFIIHLLRMGWRSTAKTKTSKYRGVAALSATVPQILFIWGNMRQDRRYQWSRTLVPGVDVPLPPLMPYQRCACGTCQECRTNAKWDQAFAKIEIKEEDNWATKGFFQSTLRGW
jgi:hypothetical protein